MENQKLKTFEEQLLEISTVYSPVIFGDTKFFGSELSIYYNSVEFGSLLDLVKEGNLSQEEVEQNNHSTKFWGIIHYPRNGIGFYHLYGYSILDLVKSLYSGYFKDVEIKESLIEQKFKQVVTLFQNYTIEIDCNPGMFIDYEPAHQKILSISDEIFISNEEKTRALKNGIYWAFDIFKNEESPIVEICGSSFESIIEYSHKKFC